jgi:hypothetical protein
VYPLSLSLSLSPHHSHSLPAPSPKGMSIVKQSSRTESPLVEEVTMASLGVKVGDRIIIDTASSKPKVHWNAHVDCTCRLDTMYNSW